MADCFPVFDGDGPAGIVVEPTPTLDDPPIVLFTPNESGELVVRLSARANQWARFAYQFAHEYCHVIADPTTWRLSEFLWLEECLCETASLFALRSIAVSWLEAPPYPNWRAYSAELDKYTDERLAAPDRSLPPGVAFGDWFEEHLSALESDAWNRDYNTIVARELLPVFEVERNAWVCVRRLHDSALLSSSGFADFAARWARLCDGGADDILARFSG